MMDEQEIGVLFGRQANCRFTEIDRRGEARDFACIANLQTV
jgi:hypothetical protein